MSLRHRKVLAQELGLDHTLVDESDEEETMPATAASAAFQAFGESSDEQSSDEDEKPPEPVSPVIKPTQSKNKKKQKEKPNRLRNKPKPNLKTWDSILEEQKVELGHADYAFDRNHISSLFDIDVKALNVEAELRRQFGGASTNIANDGFEPDQSPNDRRNPRRQNRARNAAHSLSAKRCILGPPRPDWPQPPSFIGGGIGMKRTGRPSYLTLEQTDAHGIAQWFQFEWSEDYDRLQTTFQQIQATNDPNMLVVFLARNPYHIDASLQLAMVFARTGQMDRAADMIRRSLYVHECAYLEAFKPQLGNCRLDPQLRENAGYFAGLYRHMQIVGMQGCLSVSLQLARLLLSLDPLGDPMAVLLCLDYYCLQCRRHDLLTSYYTSQLPIGLSAEQSEIAQTLEELPTITIADLPNWNFSMAVSHIWRDEYEDAMRILKTAVFNYPMFIPPLITHCGADVEHSDSMDWATVLHHEFFAGIHQRISENSVLFHLADVYATRCGNIWKEEALLLILYRACVDVLQGISPALARHLGTQQEKLSRLSSLSSPLHKYKTTLLEDYKDEYARLPPDMNPLDPQLVDPRVLAGRAQHIPQPVPQQLQQQDLQQWMLENLLAGGGGGGGEDVQALLAQFAAQQQAAAEQRGNLDPHLPLLQLFFQTLLPWNEINATGPWEEQEHDDNNDNDNNNNAEH